MLQKFRGSPRKFNPAHRLVFLLDVITILAKKDAALRKQLKADPKNSLIKKKIKVNEMYADKAMGEYNQFKSVLKV